MIAVDANWAATCTHDNLLCQCNDDEFHRVEGKFTKNHMHG